LQFGRFDRFRQLIIEARVSCLSLVFLLPPAGECNQHHFVAPRLLTNVASRLVAVHPRHADVHQDGVGLEIGGSVNPDSIAFPFDTSAYDAKIDPNDSILSLAERLAKYGGGGTDCSLPQVMARKGQSLTSTTPTA
jgi:hypothetical protein